MSPQARDSTLRPRSAAPAGPLHRRLDRGEGEVAAVDGRRGSHRAVRPAHRPLRGLDHRTLLRSADHPRTLLVEDRPVTLPTWDPRWGSNAYTYSGGTRVYGAQAWRFLPADFRMASTYGVPDGSALADWPIGYPDLEPYYSRAEWEIGVCGSTVGDSRLAFRSRHSVG